MARNSKYEIRNTKQIPNDKFENSNGGIRHSDATYGVAVWNLVFCRLRFVSDFEFRISDF